MNRSLDDLMKELLPPNDYAHREGFNIEVKLDKLSDEEKSLVENEFIKRLNNQINIDTLITEALVYIRSFKSLPVLYGVLRRGLDLNTRAIIACHIYQLDHNTEMIDIYESAFIKFDKWSKISAFYDLKKFNTPETDQLIMDYVDSPDFLLSYNSKRALGIFSY